MNKLNNWRQNHTAATLFLVILFFFALTSLSSFLKFRSAHYFGKVLEISASNLIIADKKVGSRQFLVTEKTKIRSGRQIKAVPMVGDEIMVVAEKTGGKQLEALEIRIFDPRR